ncbi:hypothetical protein RJ60_05895 [Mesotoga sp. B105.6.4]|nr:hypothetical protein RJ60_05895 [Mesotoga sp. B105.6.4]
MHNILFLNSIGEDPRYIRCNSLRNQSLKLSDVLPVGLNLIKNRDKIDHSNDPRFSRPNSTILWLIMLI